MSQQQSEKKDTYTKEQLTEFNAKISIEDKG